MRNTKQRCRATPKSINSNLFPLHQTQSRPPTRDPRLTPPRQLQTSELHARLDGYLKRSPWNTKFAANAHPTQIRLTQAHTHTALPSPTQAPRPQTSCGRRWPTPNPIIIHNSLNQAKVTHQTRQSRLLDPRDRQPDEVPSATLPHEPPRHHIPTRIPRLTHDSRRLKVRLPQRPLEINT